jgi:glycosyltransferase involved in cell wall biosynthesis
MRSFHDVYNPAMAIRVLERLRATHSGATLVMGGQDKGTEIETRRLARRLGLEDATRFPGFLDMEGKLREGESADIFINTSHVDNMPVAVVEAAAFGIPVVSTSVGGVMDLLTDRETALLVPDGDVDAMTGAIRLLLADQELAGRLSAGGRTLAERSGWDRVRPQWDEVFVKVLAAGGDTPGQASNVRP